MPLKIHALMQHADDIDSNSGCAVENNVRTDGVFTIARPDVFTRTPTLWVPSDCLDRFM